MKKRIYRAVPVNSVNVEKVVEGLNGRVVFGNDAAKDQWYGAFMTPSGEVIQTVSWDLVDGMSDVLKLLEKLGESGVAVEIAVEPTGTYADPMVYQYHRIGLPVYRVSPKASHDFAEIYDGVPSSHDAKSAAIVARLHLLKREESKIWPRAEDELERRDMMSAVSRLDWLKQSQLQTENRLESRMGKHWPGLTRIIGLSGVSTVALLKKYGGPERVAADPEGARRLLRHVSRRKLAEDKIEAVIQSARDRRGLPMSSEELMVVRELAEQLCEIRDKIKNAEKRLESYAGSNEVVQRMGKEIGKATSGVLFAKLGDLNGYDSVRSAEKAAGLNLKERSSGKLKGQLKITKRGSSTARRWLYLAVLRWIQKDEVAKAWYDRKVARDGGKKMRGLVALMRKLLAGLYYVARGAEFDSRKLFDTRLLELPEG